MSPSHDSASLLELFPLEHIPETVLDNFCKVIFEWKDCAECGNQGTCSVWGCPWGRRPKLHAYLQFYKHITSWAIPEDPYDSQKALKSHDDLLSIVRFIKDRPDVPRNHLLEEYFPRYGEARPHRKDQLRAFHLALRVIALTDCSLKSFPLVRWDPGFGPVVWRGTDSARQFISLAFPTRKPIALHDDNARLMVSALTAKKLEDCGLEIVGTNDLHKHLLLDPKSKVIRICHYAGFLKEQLILTRDRGTGPLEILPRQLTLETLHSLQSVLFPWDDKPSSELAQAKGFDTACIGFDLTDYYRDDEVDIRYQHWGARFQALYEEVEKLKQRGPIKLWWNRRSAACKWLLMFVVTLGAFCVGTFSAWTDGRKKTD